MNASDCLKPVRRAMAGLVLLCTVLGAASPSDRRAPSATTPSPEAPSPPQKVYFLQDSVVVSAAKVQLPLRRLAISATVVPLDQIRSGTSETLQGALQGVPGIHAYDPSGTGTQGVVESRGFTASGRTSYVLVLVDEVPVNDIETNGVDWNLLSLSQVERIELLRGPASFLYGNSSMAGLVNIVTQKPGPGLGTWGQLDAGSYQRLSYTLGLEGAAPRLAGTASMQRLTQDGFRHHSDGSLTSGYGQFWGELSPSWRVRGRLILQRSGQNIAGPLPDPMYKDDPRQALDFNNGSWTGSPLDDRHTEIAAPSLEFRGHLSPRIETVASMRADLRDVEATETIIPVGALDRKSRSRGLNGEARLQWDTPLPVLRTCLLGVEAGDGWLRSRYYENKNGLSGPRVGAGKVAQRDLALFAYLRGEPLAMGSLPGSLVLSGGLRWDRSRSDLAPLEDPGGIRGKASFSDFSPAVGLNYELPGSGNAYLSLAGSFKAPTLEQLYDQRPYDLDGPGPAPPIHLSSAALKPQRGIHVEVGVRSSPIRRLNLEASLYQARSRDEIGFDLANFRYANIDKSTHFGGEGQITYAPWSRLRLQAGYTYTRAVFDGGENDGKQINGVPRQIAHARAGYTHPWGGTLTLEVTDVHRQWLDEGNRYPIPSYTVADLGFVQKAGPLQLLASVGNLFDRIYAPTAYLTTTFDMSGPHDLPLYFPAAGRSFRLGLRRDIL